MAAPDPAGPLVALVDDDAAVRSSLADLLLSAGYRVHCFAGAEPLLAWEGRADLACVVSDLSMPGRSGLDLIRRLAGDGATAGCIVVAARVTDDLERQIRQAGAICLLPKPVAADELLRCVAAACRHGSR